jgi:transcriptional regulator with XRE-family HTH domain
MSGHATRTFAARLKEAQADRTNEELAAAVGVRVRTVVRWRGGASEPYGDQLARLCAVLDKPVDFFYPDQAVPA